MPGPRPAITAHLSFCFVGRGLDPPRGVEDAAPTNASCKPFASRRGEDSSLPRHIPLLPAIPKKGGPHAHHQRFRPLLKGVGPAFSKNLRSSASSPSATCFCAIRANTSTTRSPYTVVSAPYDVECCVRATVLQRSPPGASRAGGSRIGCWRRTIPAFWHCRGSMRPYAADKLEVGGDLLLL